MHEVDAVGIGGQPLGGQRQGVRVAVDADELCPRAVLQQIEAVAGQAERGVDEHGAVVVEGRRQEFADPRQHHRVVPHRPGRLGHGDSADQLGEGGEDDDRETAEQEGRAGEDGTVAQFVPERAVTPLGLELCANVVHLPLLDPG